MRLEEPGSLGHIKEGRGQAVSSGPKQLAEQWERNDEDVC